MRKLAIGGAAVAIAVVAAAGGAVTAMALDDDELEVQAITVPVSQAASVDDGAGAGAGAGSLVAEDGITADEARRLARAATTELPGTAISVERDDGLYGVEVRDRVGAIVEVLVDLDGRVVGMDRGDD